MKRSWITIFVVITLFGLIFLTIPPSPEIKASNYTQSQPNDPPVGFQSLNNPDYPNLVNAGILPAGIRPFFQRHPVSVGNTYVQLNSFFDHKLPTSRENDIDNLPTDLVDINANQTLIFTNESRTGTVTLCTKGFSCYSNHNGLDYNTAGLIYAPATGRISFLRYSNTIDPVAGDVCGVGIKHDISIPADNSFEFSTRYWHLASIAHASDNALNRPNRECDHPEYWCEGDPIAPGELIGTAGDDSCGGSSTGTHLHFEVASGELASGDNLRTLDPFGWFSETQDPWADSRLSEENLLPQTSYWLWGTPPNPAPNESGYWGDNVFALVDDNNGAFSLIVPESLRTNINPVLSNTDQNVLPVGERAWRVNSIATSNTNPPAVGYWGLYVPTSGTYRIEAHIPKLPSGVPTAASDAVYHVTIPLPFGSLDPWDSIAINQARENEWVILQRDPTTDTFQLSASSVVLVELPAKTSTAGQSVIYDAIRLVSVSTTPPPIEQETSRLGFVIDNSSSMLSIGKLDAVKSSIPPWIDTLEASSRSFIYAFNQFANNVLPVHVTEDADEFKSFIDALNGNDNGISNTECPEESLDAIRSLAPHVASGDLLFFTDDIPFSPATKGPLARSSLLQNNVRLHSILLPKTCTFDGTSIDGFFTYRVLSTLTGGTYQQLTSTDQTSNALQIVQQEMQSNTEIFAVNSSDLVMNGFQSLEDTNEYNIQIDDTIDSVNFLLTKYESSLVDFTIFRPNGNPVSSLDTDVSFVDSGSAKYFIIQKPSVGTWTIVVDGTGEFDLRVSGESLLTYSYVGEVQSSPGEWVELVAQISGPVASAGFNLIDASGIFISNVDLADDGDGGDIAPDDGLYTGYFQANTIGDYRLQLFGETSSGSDFVRTDPRLIRVRNVSITDPKPKTIAPDTFHTFIFEIHNAGDISETYDLSASSGFGWISDGPPIAITVGPGQTMPVHITVYVPPDASPNQIDNLILSATLQTDRSVITEGGTAIIVPDIDLLHEDSLSKAIYLPLAQNRFTSYDEPFAKVKIWDGKLYWQSDTSIKKDSVSSMRLEADVFSDAEVYSNLIHVLPNQAYSVSYWVKTNLIIDDSNIYGRVITAQYSNEALEDDEIFENRTDPGWNLGENEGSETDWVFKTYTFTTTSNTHFVRLRAPMGLDGHAKGQVWFDNVNIEEVE